LYGRTALISNVIAKARDKVKSFYGFSDRVAEVKAAVEWLIQDAHFIFGSVDVKVLISNRVSFISLKVLYQKSEFDDKKPFGSELMIEIIQSQWFPTSSRIKGDAETTTRMVEEGVVPLAMIFLTLTAVRHPLNFFSFSLLFGRLNTL
jgi:hypothetical protein